MATDFPRLIFEGDKMNKINRKPLNKVIIFALFNTIILLYLYWDKYNNNQCISCSKVPILDISDDLLALGGLIASTVLTALILFSFQKNIFTYINIFISGLAAGFSSFLVGVQILTNRDLCHLCLISSVSFYIIFSLLVTNNLLPIIRDKFGIMFNK